MGGFFTVDLSEVEWTLSFPYPGCGDPLFPEENSTKHNHYPSWSFDCLGVAAHMTITKATRENHQTTSRRGTSSKVVMLAGISNEAVNMKAKPTLPAAHRRNSLTLA